MTNPNQRRGWRRRAVIAAVLLVPLAFAGLFVAALPSGQDGPDAIPAAVVNQDQLVQRTAADGTKTPVFAGRQLVTELVAGGAGFHWSVSNAADAEAALAAGDVDAVLTIPKGFSASILSLSSPGAKRAAITLRTNDATSYLTGLLAQAVGAGMADAFGTTITENYLTELSLGMAELGSSLTKAATGAGTLADGADRMHDGLSALAAGAEASANGASGLAGGIDRYTRGVDGLSSGLSSLRSGAAGLSGIRDGVAQYTGSVGQLAGALAAANAELQRNPEDPLAQARFNGTVAVISGQLSRAAAGGSALSGKTAAGLNGIRDGINGSATGAARLAAGSAGLRAGVDSLASGLSTASAGTARSATAAAGLANGSRDLASGLTAGAERVPATDPESAAAAATVIADPVRLTVTREHEVASIGGAVAMFLVPLALWIGALAVFLVLAPLSRRALVSTAADGRLVLSGLVRAAAFTLAQALSLVALLHLAVGVPWSSLGATLGFCTLMALSFTAFHHLLTLAFGRAGLVVSLFAIAVQVTSTGGLYPVEVLSAPFQWISPLLPLTYGVSGMQGILAQGPTGQVMTSALVLAGFALASVLVALAVFSGTRRARSLRDAGSFLAPSPGNVA